MKLKGFIFDLDGTLLNTLPVCYIGFRSTLLKFMGREYSDAEIRSLFGPTEEGVFMKLLPDKWEKCLQHYLEEYEKAHKPYSKPFAGIEDSLRLLAQRKIRLGIVSGKGSGTMAISLRHSGLGKYFDVVQTGSVRGASKPAHIRMVVDSWNLAPHEVAYVGDTAYDIKAAREIGTVAIGATWADGTQKQLVLDMEPDYVFDEVPAFIKWLEANT